MKNTIAVLLVLIFVSYSCVKKKAIKYDPKLVGTWVSNSDSINSWLIISPDGIGKYATYGNDEGEANGEVDYSLFENKLWVRNRKFKVEKWITGKTDGVSELKTKVYSTLKDTTYRVDMKMILRTTIFHSRRTIVFYRVYQ